MRPDKSPSDPPSPQRDPAPNPPVIVVGGGLAGLTCARTLHRAGVAVRVFERADRVGGRVRTDLRDGFLLDRGFQVLNTAYPEARRQLDLERLDLRSFEPGALVRLGRRMHPVSDPFRRPSKVVSTLLAPIGSCLDKLRIARLRHRVLRQPVGEILAATEHTTREELESQGFSAQLIERFFEPFYGGVYLESSLETSSRWFRLLFRQFARGSAALPAAGMEQIPRQLASELPQDSLRTGLAVRRVWPDRIETVDGEVHTARAVVLACEEPVTQYLLQSGDWPDLASPRGRDPGDLARRSRGVSCVYLDAPAAPAIGASLVLNGQRRRDLQRWPDATINSLCAPSLLSAGYAPPGRNLISVTVLDERRTAEFDPDRLAAAVHEQLGEWFGEMTRGWRTVDVTRVDYALPTQGLGELRPGRAPRRGAFFVAGDHLETASIQGALVSGRKTAATVLCDLGIDRRAAA